MLAGPRFARKLCVHSGHDFHQRGFTRAVWPNNADLCIRIELQIDVVEDGLACAGEGFRHSLHYEAILGCHGL